MTLTLRGTIFLGLWLVAVGALLYFGEWPFLFLALFLPMILLLSAALLARTASRLVLEQELESTAVVRSETVLLRLKASIPGIPALFRFTAEIRTPRSELGLDRPLPVDLAFQAGRNAEASVPLACPYRGLYEVGLLGFRFQDPLGLFRLSWKAGKRRHPPGIPPLSLLSLPPAHPVPLTEALREIAASEGPGRTRPTDESGALADLRAFRPGDRIKKVHWKNTARTGKIQVKEFEESTLPTTLFVLDDSDHGLRGLPGIRLEDAMLERLMGHMSHLVSLPVAFSFLSGGRSQVLVSVTCPRELPAVQRMLGEATFRGDPLFHEVLQGQDRIRHADRILLHSARPDEALAGTLRSLRRPGRDIRFYPAVLGPPDPDLSARLERLRAEGIAVELLEVPE